MSQRRRVPGMRVPATRIPLCSLHLAQCVKVGGEFVCPICMQEHAPVLSMLTPNRRARRAVV